MNMFEYLQTICNGIFVEQSITKLGKILQLNLRTIYNNTHKQSVLH
jgi:hypothetical protein